MILPLLLFLAPRGLPETSLASSQTRAPNLPPAAAGPNRGRLLLAVDANDGVEELLTFPPSPLPVNEDAVDRCPTCAAIDPTIAARSLDDGNPPPPPGASA